MRAVGLLTLAPLEMSTQSRPELLKFLSLMGLAIFFPIFAHAAALININTADAALLDTLPGIGPAKATAIIDYRTQNGPFAQIADIQNVSGIGPTTYADIAPLITVGDAEPADPPPSPPDPEESAPPETSPEVTSTSATVPPAANGGYPTEYLPIPVLRIIAGDARTVSSGADVAFTAAVYDGKGNRRDDAVVAWSFGDGMRRTGASVFHAYYEPGEYLAIVHATTPDGGDERSEILVTVKNAGVKITSVSSRGIALTNSDSRALDLSQWRLFMGGQEFRIPADTYVLAGRTILFPAQVIQLPVANTASLRYPGGEVAATYPASAPVQPAPRAVSYEKVQTVEPPVVSKAESIISTRTVVPVYEKAVPVPTAATELAAVGTALALSPLAPDENSRALGFFRSPWVLSFLGVVALAGSAFIFL